MTNGQNSVVERRWIADQFRMVRVHLLRKSRVAASAPIDLFDHYEEAAEAYVLSMPFLQERRDGIVSLHFKPSEVQSEMDTAAPERLVLGYTRTMMGFLLYNRKPARLGMIGLGGGSLAKYCYRHLPKTSISVAEINPEVIAFRDRFFVPKDGPRFQVVCEEGADFVRRQRNHFDVLMVDGFDGMGQPPQLCSQSFYDACREALSPSGILVANVCDAGRSMLVARLRKSFERRVLVVAGDQTTNTIAFATNSLTFGTSDAEYKQQAARIERWTATARRWAPHR